VYIYGNYRKIKTGVSLCFGRLCIPVIFNLFSEVEPFAAILVAHRTHVFLGGLLRPTRRAEIRGRPRAGIGFYEGQRAPSPQARGSHGALLAPPVRIGAETFLDLLRAYRKRI